MSLNKDYDTLGVENRRVRMPICDRVINTEISNDYTLPDYQQEIRRILHVGATVTQPSKYVSAAGAEFSGIIDYDLIYVGTDGQLYTTPLTAEYSLNVPIDNDSRFDFNEGITSCCDLVCENITTRLSGARKLNVKCRMRSHVKAFAAMILDEKINGVYNAANIQTLSVNQPNLVVLRDTSECIRVSEEIVNDMQNGRVIGATGKVFISEASASDGGVNVKGEIYLKLLGTEDGKNEITQTNRRVPFFSKVDFDEKLTDCSCCASGKVSDISVEVEDQRIICDIGLVLDVQAQKNEYFNYVKDLYSTENETENVYRDYKVPTYGKCFNGNFSVNERLSKENISMPENADVVDVYAVAVVDSFNCADKRGTINVQIKYTLVLCKDGEYSSIDIVLPSKYEFECDDDKITSLDADLEVFSCKVRQDSECISIDSEIGVCAKGMGAEEIIALSESTVKDYVNKYKNVITVCYPAEDDTLWSIAKRYHIPRERIDALNDTDGELDKRSFVIV